MGGAGISITVTGDVFSIQVDERESATNSTPDDECGRPERAESGNGVSLFNNLLLLLIRTIVDHDVAYYR